MRGGLKGGLAIGVEGICEIHRRFCELLPEDLLWVEDTALQERVRIVPGALRTHGVRVGNHVVISPGALPRFLERFAQVYSNAGKTESIVSTAAAHHRLLWIHPFILETAVNLFV
jgi:Fic family protein